MHKMFITITAGNFYFLQQRIPGYSSKAHMTSCKYNSTQKQKDQEFSISWTRFDDFFQKKTFQLVFD